MAGGDRILTTVDVVDGVAEGEVEDAYDDGRTSIKTNLATDGVLYLQDVETDISPGDEVELYYSGEDPGSGDIIRVLKSDSD